MRIEFTKDELVAILARSLPPGITTHAVEIDFNRMQQTLTVTFDLTRTMVHEKGLSLAAD